MYITFISAEAAAAAAIASVAASEPITPKLVTNKKLRQKAIC